MALNLAKISSSRSVSGPKSTPISTISVKILPALVKARFYEKAVANSVSSLAMKKSCATGPQRIWVVTLMYVYRRSCSLLEVNEG